MPSPIQNSSQNPQPSPPPESTRARDPAIRTMRSDVEGLFQKNQPSVAQMMAQTQTPPREKIKFRFHFPFSYKIFAVLGAVIILAGFIYFFPSFFPKAFPGAQKPPATQPAGTSVAFFSTESVTPLTIQLDHVPFFTEIKSVVKASDRQKTIRKIVIQFVATQKTPARIASVSDFFNLYRITAPSQFLERLYPDFMPFVFYGKTGGRFGFLMRTKDPARTLRDVISWEKSLARDFDPFLFDAPVTQISPSFEDKTYRNIDWRFLHLSKDQDLGIAYTLFPAKDYLIFTTSKEAMETVIDRIFGGK